MASTGLPVLIVYCFTTHGVPMNEASKTLQNAPCPTTCLKLILRPAGCLSLTFKVRSRSRINEPCYCKCFRSKPWLSSIITSFYETATISFSWLGKLRSPSFWMLSKTLSFVMYWTWKSEPLLFLRPLVVTRLIGIVARTLVCSLVFCVIPSFSFSVLSVERDS